MDPRVLGQLALRFSYECVCRGLIGLFTVHSFWDYLGDFLACI